MHARQARLQPWDAEKGRKHRLQLNPRASGWALSSFEQVGERPSIGPVFQDRIQMVFY
jgi:hypothetical protein